MAELENTTANKHTDEDLEDGEIDDDDDDDNDDVIILPSNADNNSKNCNGSNSSSNINAKINKMNDGTTPITTQSIGQQQQQQLQSSGKRAKYQDDSDIECTIVSTNINPSSLRQNKKPAPVEDDHASSIEHAIANALKKKGIEPPMPKLESRHAEDADATVTLESDIMSPSHNAVAIGGSHGSSRSSRRRKRRKDREEKRKQIEHIGGDTAVSGTSSANINHSAAEEDSSDMDEYEMMNVRGGSPPPLALSGVGNSSSNLNVPNTSSSRTQSTRYNGEYDGHSSSYESLYTDEDDDERGGGVGSSSSNRRRRETRKRNSRKRRDRNEHSRSEKRGRRDSDDDTNSKQRPELPRKLELCKFYLMERCAKRDKCSYMHQDFPCKYYYLGMECFSERECMFHHGQPLSEQLRNILLKHIETAPKEILGNFKRISRESASAQITRRHEELCKKYNMQNTWGPIPNLGLNAIMPMSGQRRGNSSGGVSGSGTNACGGNVGSSSQMEQSVQHHGQPQQPQNTINIPSLFDLVIEPPDDDLAANAKRKAIWATDDEEQPSRNLPSHLDLKNLCNTLTTAQMAKLNKLGITNLSQLNHMTIAQITEAGLTIAEVSELQTLSEQCGIANCKQRHNNEKMQHDVSSDKETSTATANVAMNNFSSNGDIDMRVLHIYPTIPDSNESSIPTGNALERDILSSNSNSNSNGVLTVDYTQYLKDSNLANFERNDPLDDEKDEETLVIDVEDDDETAELEKEREKESESGKDKEADNVKIAEFDIHANASDESETNTTVKEPPVVKYSSFFSAGLIGTKEPRTAEERAQFLRDLIRNPFKTHQIDDDDNTNSNDAGGFYARLNDSRSQTPTPCQSSTPEPTSQSPQPSAEETHLYVRRTMYDYDPIREKKVKKRADIDMRYPITGIFNDIDLRLPFQPVVHNAAASEIDASYVPFNNKPYRLVEIDYDEYTFDSMREHFKDTQTPDPRIRRILGLPELSKSEALQQQRKVSIPSPEINTITSPNTTPTSPPPYMPPYTSATSINSSSNNSTVSSTNMLPQPPSITPASAAIVLKASRRDPRRAAMEANNAAQANNATLTLSSASNMANKQSNEIRNLLQKSEWYKNLGSNSKIMVNQQLALVSIELKKFHQSDAANKMFDVNFIINNNTIQQIFTQLGIYIDDNGEIVHIIDDASSRGGGNKCNNNNNSSNGNNSNSNDNAIVGNSNNNHNLLTMQQNQLLNSVVGNGIGSVNNRVSVGSGTGNGGAGAAGLGGFIQLPNMSLPPPNALPSAQQAQQLNFLQNPPPNILPHAYPRGLNMNLPAVNLAAFNLPPPNQRPSLLGIPPLLGGVGPGGPSPNVFNAFASTGNMNDNMNLNARFMNAGISGASGAAGLGPGVLMAFNNNNNNNNYGAGVGGGGSGGMMHMQRSYSGVGNASGNVGSGHGHRRHNHNNRRNK